MKKIPKTITLQTHDHEGVPYDMELDEITWSREAVEDFDTRYIQLNEHYVLLGLATQLSMGITNLLMELPVDEVLPNTNAAEVIVFCKHSVRQFMAYLKDE